MVDLRSKKDPIPGYTGCLLSKQEDTNQIQQISSNGQVPGYIGYIPAVKSENLYGKTYGKITENCYNGKYHQGIDLPPPAKYLSSVKQAYMDPKILKDQQINQGKINGLKISTFSSAGRFVVNPNQQTSIQQQPLTKLTYQQACKIAYK